LLKGGEKKFKTLEGEPLLYGNAGGRGYYRSAYSADAYAVVVAKTETELTPAERIGLVGDQWALMRADRSTAASYMDLMNALSHDTSAAVLRNALAGETVIGERIATDAEQDAMSAWERDVFGPIYRALPKPTENDSADLMEMRTQLFSLLGASDDAGVIAEAREIAAKYMADPTAVESSLGQAALSVTIDNADAKHGDAALYDAVLKWSQTETDPELQTEALFSLAEFRDPALVERTLNYVADGKVRNQDSWLMLVMEMNSRETREQTWEYMKKNWTKIAAQLTESSGGDVVESAGGFCTVEKRTDVTNFFAQIKVDASSRAMKTAIDNINGCILLRKTQEPSLHDWLTAHGHPPAAEKSPAAAK
jgi:aminopeptidase N/puromycin-sensitive aminopeptidase